MHTAHQLSFPPEAGQDWQIQTVYFIHQQVK